MANQPTPATPGTGSQLTAQNVIDMFKDLSLPVCDDGDLIMQKYDARKPYYQRCLRNPTPSIHEKGEQGLKNGDAMQNRRPELLRVVYGHFLLLANGVLSAALASGTKTLTTGVLDNLRQVLQGPSCNVEEQLAERFLLDYMRDRGLELEKELVSPGVIEDFTAASEMGRIALRWSLPQERCDEIEIAREAETPAQQKKKAKPQTIYRGRDTTFTDHDVAPGRRYTYRACSVLHNTKGPSVAAHAVCIGEVRAPSAVWQAGGVKLSWELAGASVVIFRCTNAAASVQVRVQGPEPATSSTTQVYRGGGASWTDSDVAEGVNYHYRIIADFGGGIFSQGIEVQAAVPKAPPAVATLKASYQPGDGPPVVALEWPPVSSNMPVEYVVTRREGNTAPARVNEGKMLPETTQTRCLDAQVSAGQRYSYAVFARVGNLYSRTGTAAPPVDILAEVSALAANTDDGTVELQWTTPARVRNVIIRRSVNPPRDCTDGVQVPLTGAGHAKDEGLRNRQRYHYLVCCAYRPDGVAEAVSPGIRLTATPEGRPQAAKDFAARAAGPKVVCTWTPPERGLTVVVRGPEPSGLTWGQSLAADEVSCFGQRVVATGQGQAEDTQPDAGQPYYHIFTIAGTHAIAGGSGSALVCPDISDLQLTATRNGVILRWVWPRSCAAVRVVRRADAWPAGPQDTEASSRTVTQASYAAAGDKLVDEIQESRGRFHYAVYAQATGGAGLFFSPGTSAGCRAVVQWEPWMTLRYSFLPSGPDATLRLAWSLEQPFPDFGGFVLVAGQSRVPDSPAAGVELFRWQPLGTLPDGAQVENISLAPLRQRRWARFYCNLFVLDPAQQHTTLIVHPNTCVPFSETGAPELNRPAGDVRGYRTGVPQTVICPRCFDEFPAREMLFTSFGGGEAQPARYTWRDRLLRRPPQPPHDKQGRRLTRKVGPNCQHDLPFTAGAQESLIIGLIGAKFSGKSHYVATLVKRLQEQVCNDLQASLIPMSDETQDRYQHEFYEPLFGKGLELPVTVGTPPPLIYDLTLSGALWGEARDRAVTLTLYDTAGENLEQADTVRQMVEYLRMASGIIFLIDPLQTQEVRELLPAHILPRNLDSMADPNVILSRVLQELENGQVLTGGTLSTPIAVVLTKCDVLREAGLIAENRLWSTAARHIGYFDTQAHEDMAGMMGAYTQRWSPAAYNTVLRRFPHHAFFGVSATGCAPDSKTRRYKYVSPWRVEDPLLWLLAEMGVIPHK